VEDFSTPQVGGEKGISCRPMLLVGGGLEENGYDEIERKTAF